MSHLPTERLAALADEAPSAAELAHLATCEDCTRERAAFQHLAVLATSESARIGKPLTNWEELSPALTYNGLVAVRRERSGRRWLQAAAAVLLASGGAVAGRWSASTVAAVAQVPTVVTTAAAPFSSLEQARSAQVQAQSTYQSATAFIAQHDTSVRETPSSIRTRLAALEQVNAAIGQALTKAPDDPVINGYYVTTLGQRQATIRQLSNMGPVSTRLTTY